MFRSILPKEYAFFKYFEEHIELTEKAGRHLKLLANNKIDLLECSKEIHEIEKLADDVTHKCTDALHKTFITPIERTDIFLLIKRLDDLTDFIDGAVQRMYLYDVQEIRVETKDIAEILGQSIELLKNAIQKLNNIKHNQKEIQSICEKVRSLENQGDIVFQEAISRLFKEQDAVVIIKWKEIFERFEKAVDRCESIANVIESVLIDNA